MNFLSKAKDRINFLHYVLSEPKLLLKTIFYLGKFFALHKKPHSITRESPTAKKILLDGLLKVELDSEGIALVNQASNQFSKLISNEKFVSKPDSERPNTLTYGKYLFVFKGLWRLFYPEIPYLVEKYAGNTLRSYFGENYEIISVELARKKYLPKDFHMKDVFSNFWHFDFRRKNTSWLLIVLNLNEHNEQEAFRTFDLQTSTKALKKGLNGRYSPEELPEELKDQKVIVGSGPAGTCYIANTADMLHRSGYPSPGKDRDVAFIFVSANVQWPTESGFKQSTPQTIDTVPEN